MSNWMRSWLVAADGLYLGQPGGSWQRLGSADFGLSSALREPGRLVAGACVGSGLWEWRAGGDRWVQLHDETLTEVLALARVPGDPGVIAGSPYGLALGRRDELGAVRWHSCSDGLRVNERFTNTVLVDPSVPGRWLVGTEAGVLLAEESGKRWTHTSLTGTPVRALLHALGTFWAGTDERGIWRSDEGRRWNRVGRGMEEETIFALAQSHGRILAGSRRGVMAGDGAVPWERLGPPMLAAAVAAHPARPECWLAGASPGGLWGTEDSGATWRQLGTFNHVRALLAPEEI
ncbi:MAG: hypothetical protein HYW07_24675 [Candidatus Latescibacteria bacterium]|nr:hypothetical protein [Candidatus Latescibacterota bacterium]